MILEALQCTVVIKKDRLQQKKVRKEDRIKIFELKKIRVITSHISWVMRKNYFKLLFFHK